MLTDAINFVFLSQSHPAITIMIPNKQQIDIFIKLSINILTEWEKSTQRPSIYMSNCECFPPFTNALFASFHIYLHQTYPMSRCPVALHCEAFYYFLQLALIFIILSDCLVMYTE